MKTAFADTSFFIAFLCAGDSLHSAAEPYIADREQSIVTTRWVLAELGNYVCRRPERKTFPIFVRDLECSIRARILAADDQLFQAGMNLYAERSDKAWSFTDCMSFVAMKQLDLSDALTADRHFQQAGFKALLL